jgi:hypothetical protein
MLPIDDEERPFGNVYLVLWPLLCIRYYIECLLRRWIQHVCQVVQGLIHSLFFVLTYYPVL